MTYNVFGGTLSLTQSINHCLACNLLSVFSQSAHAQTENPSDDKRRNTLPYWPTSNSNMGMFCAHAQQQKNSKDTPEIS